MTQAVETQTAYDYLNRALQLLEKPSTREHTEYPNSWITGAEAQATDGTYCKPESEQAVAWCTIGVVRAVTHYDPNPDAAYTYILSLLNMANPSLIAEGSKSAIPHINDRTLKFQTIQRMFRKAMQLCYRFQS